MSYVIASIIGIALGTVLGIVAKRLYCSWKCKGKR